MALLILMLTDSVCCRDSELSGDRDMLGRKAPGRLHHLSVSSIWDRFVSDLVSDVVERCPSRLDFVFAALSDQLLSQAN